LGVKRALEKHKGTGEKVRPEEKGEAQRNIQSPGKKGGGAGEKGGIGGKNVF